ncbi:hypothetical protein GOC19_29105 [Sinorhizobium meliloti]|nr:hypothetical protein [Sinorhizobium meliloti]
MKKSMAWAIYVLMVSLAWPELSVAQDSMMLYENSDIPGGNIASITGSLSHCASQCSTDKRCLAFTYNEEKSACFLKTARSSNEFQFSEFNGVISGIKDQGAALPNTADLGRLITGWENSNGAVLSKSAAEQVVANVADSLQTDLKALGIEPVIASAFGDELRNGGIVRFDDTEIASGPVRVGIKGLASIRAVNVNYIETQLVRLPRIALSVRPNPPEDFTIEVNGELAPVTKELEYAVDVGAATVRVKRIAKPDCVWSGQLQIGERRRVECQM